LNKKAKAHRSEFETSTAFEKIGTDRQLQDHWVRRLIAAAVDGIIVAVGTAILWAIFTFPLIVAGQTVPSLYSSWWSLPALVWGILWLLYASFMEFTRRSTFGKQIMNFRIITTDGKAPTFGLTLTRNVSKIYWLLWLLDVIIGMATVGDPHQKYTDRMAGTTVVSTITGSMIVPTPPSPPAPTPPSV